MRNILVTGGSGFIGTHVALTLKSRYPDATVYALDNLRRRGSEGNVERLVSRGVTFVHGDVRNPEDLSQFHALDALIECSAEPSVHAGRGNDTSYVVHTNLTGAYHCLEVARRTDAFFLFLSTSRVYPMAALRNLHLREEPTRFAIEAEQPLPGVSVEGISEDFPLTGARSLYGTTKLAAELLIAEYHDMFGLPYVINRCGVIAGPGQMGKVDQGFVTLWVARHVYGIPLAYIGYGGKGKQVRDVLHVGDLCDLIAWQLENRDAVNGTVFQVGGGNRLSTSLAELTERCQSLVGKTVPIEARPETRAADVPWYITDARRIQRVSGWAPKRSLDVILDDIYRWIRDDKERLASVFCT
jgi:CDP-paratose 2-epimerase